MAATCHYNFQVLMHFRKCLSARIDHFVTGSFLVNVSIFSRMSSPEKRQPQDDASHARLQVLLLYRYNFFFNLDIYKQQYLSRILCFNHAIVAWPANEIVSHVDVSYSNRRYSQRQPSVADRRVTTPAELCSFILNAAAGADAGPVIAVVL